MKFLRLAFALVVLTSFAVSVPAAQRDDRAKRAVATTGHGSAAADLKMTMRKLWTDHTVWTRDYIIAAVDDKPDAMAAANRLMKNQEDIGNAITGYYGAAAG